MTEINVKEIAEEIAAKVDRYYADRQRDLAADLAICEAATPGPWIFSFDELDEFHYIRNELNWLNVMASREQDARFIAEAREGWPAAIRRAQAAEAEVERLKRRVEVAFGDGYSRGMDYWNELETEMEDYFDD